MKKILLAIPLFIIAAACTHKTENTKNDMEYSEGVAHVGTVIGYRNSKPVNAIPKAMAFRMTGDYANNVAIFPRSKRHFRKLRTYKSWQRMVAQQPRHFREIGIHKIYFRGILQTEKSAFCS